MQTRAVGEWGGAEGGAKGEGGYLSAPPVQMRRRGPYTFHSRVLHVRGAEEGEKVGGIPFCTSCTNEEAVPLCVPFACPVCESCSHMRRGWR